MNEKQDWTTAGGPNKLSKKPIGFFSSYESKDQTIKKSKPSKLAQINFLKKLRSMRKKLKYLTEAQESEQQLQLFHKKYCSEFESQTPSSQQYLKRTAPSHYDEQIFRKLLKVEQEKNQNQFNEEASSSSMEVKSVTRYFQHSKQEKPQIQQKSEDS